MSCEFSMAVFFTIYVYYYELYLNERYVCLKCFSMTNEHSTVQYSIKHSDFSTYNADMFQINLYRPFFVIK